MTYTVKKKDSMEPQKKVRWMTKSLQMCSEFKKNKKYLEPLRNLTVYLSEDPFFFETFLSSVDQKIGFVGKYETFRVSYQASRLRASNQRFRKKMEPKTKPEPKFFYISLPGIGTVKLK